MQGIALTARALLGALALLAAGCERAPAAHAPRAAHALPATAAEHSAPTAPPARTAATSPSVRYAEEMQWRLQQRVEALAARGDAARLREAATLSLLVAGRPEQHLALARRAAAAAPQDAWLARLEYTYCLRVRTCGEAAARSRLQALEPDNAAHLLDALTREPVRRDPAGTDALLHAAAARTTFDWGFEATRTQALQALEHATLPPMDARTREAFARDGGFAPGDEDTALRRAMAGGVAAAMPAPGFAGLFDACRPGRAGALSGARRADCQVLARRVADDGTQLGRMIGLGLLTDIASPAQQAQVRDEWRQFAWLQAQFVRYPQANRFALQADAATEMERARQMLQRAGLALQPPAGWLPSDPCQRARVTGQPRPPRC